MTTVPKDPQRAPVQAPNVDKFNPLTGKGIAAIGPPIVGNSPPGAYQAEPTTGLGKGAPAGPPQGTKPFVSEND